MMFLSEAGSNSKIKISSLAKNIACLDNQLGQDNRIYYEQKRLSTKCDQEI